MPTSTINRYRLYCKQCDNFTLHERIYIDEDKHPKFKECTFTDDKKYVSLCECGCQYTSIPVNEIDEKKITEQRKRFRTQRSENFKKLLNVYQSMGALDTLFSEPHIGYKIIESDAGLEHEEKLQREAEKELKAKQKLELATYKNVGRNDVCLCGSGLKYKKCCLNKHLKY